MKTKITAKLAKYYAKKPIAVGYANIQYLLYFRNADWYTCGIYGWNYDIYHNVYGRTITTGYRGMFGVPVDYEYQQKFETEAQKIIADNSLSWEDKEFRVENLLKDFIGGLENA